MKALMISTDQKILESGSEAQKRMRDYGMIFEELYIIVFSTRKSQIPNPKSQINSKIQIANNVFVYPTNSRFELFYLWQAYQIGQKIIHNSKFQIHNSAITCQDPFETGFVGWLMKKRFDLPLQLQVHTDVFSPYFKNESLLNRLRVLLAKFLLPRADGIRVVSQRIKDSLESNVKGPWPDRQMSNVLILPIFVDVKKIQSAKVKIDLHQKYPEYDFIILMASRLTKEKNISMAIKAFGSAKRQAPSAENPLLLIVGDGPKKQNLMLQASSFKLQENVKFEPWTNDLGSYYKTADLCLLTSNYEGYGRTVVEAMAAGLPVVMTEVGLAGELLIDDLDGKVVPVGDEKALAAAILELKENPAKREEYKLNSLKLLEKWPSKQEYLDKYRNLLMVLK